MSRHTTVQRPRRARWRVVGAAAVAAALLSGCVTQAPGPTPSGTVGEADMRTRIADGLAADDDGLAALVRDEATTLTPVPAPWLPDAQIVDVLARGTSGGARLHVALRGSGEVVVLTPETFVALVAGVRVPDEATAVAVVDTYLDTTRSFRQWSQRVSSLDEVDLLPTPDAEQLAAWEALRARLDAEVGPTRAVARDDGFDVVAWVADGATLVRHDVRLTRDGDLSDRPTVLADDLPVPVSP